MQNEQQQEKTKYWTQTKHKIQNNAKPETSRSNSLPGLQIYLQPRLTLTFDLVTQNMLIVSCPWPFTTKTSVNPTWQTIRNPSTCPLSSCCIVIYQLWFVVLSACFVIACVCRSVVCRLSVTLLLSMQRLELFGNIFASLNSLETRTVCFNIFGKILRGSRGSWKLNKKKYKKLAFFRPITLHYIF